MSVDSTELKLDILVASLIETLYYLSAFNYPLNNLVVLRERLEALEAERVDRLTPERILKVVEQRSLKPACDKSSSEINPVRNWWQKIVNYKHKRLVLGIAIIASTVVGWGTAYNLLMKQQQLNNSPLEKVNNSPNETQ